MGQGFLHQGTIVHAKDEVLVLTLNPSLQNKVNRAFVLGFVVLLLPAESHCTVKFYLKFVMREMAEDD